MSSVDEMVIKWSMDSKSFNDGLTAMNRNMSVLKSGFNATATRLKAFGSETDQLKNKQKYLTEAITIQKGKVDSLKNSYDKQVQATGENSREAQNLAIKLNNQISYYNRLESELKQTNTELEQQSSKWNKVSKSLENTSKKLEGIGSKLSGVGNKLTFGLTTPLLGAGAASFKLASDMTENINKVEVVFGKNAEKVQQWANTTLKQFGISNMKALELAGGYGNLAVSMGFNSDKAMEFGISLTGLAADMASLNNTSLEEASNALNAIFTGEAEPMKKFGAIMTENNLQLYATEKGIKKKVSAMTDEEKITLRYNFVLDKTKTAQGDFARSSESASNQTKTFRQAMQQLGATFGNNLLPVITPFIVKLNDVILKFASLDVNTQQNIVKFGLFAVAVGPVISTIGKLSTGIGKTMDFANKAGQSFKKMKESQALVTLATKAQTLAQKALNFVMGLNPVTLIITGLIALGATFTILYNKCEWFRNGVNEVWSTITGIFTNFDNFLTGIFTIDWTNNFGVLGNIFNSFFANVSNYWEAIKNVFSGVIDFVAGVFTLEWSRAWEGVKNIFGGIMDGLGAVIKAPLNTVIGLINMAIDGLNTISFTAPDWVPIVGGKHFGVDLPKINYLYEGGIIDRPTFLNSNTVVGDSYKGLGRQAEAVIPLARMYSNLRKIVKEEAGARQTIIYTTNIFKVDGKEMYRETTRKVVNTINRSTNNYKKGKGGFAYG